MKSLLLIAASLYSLSAFGFDVWREEAFDGGETIFSSGTSEALLIGSRGLGYSIPSVEVIVGDHVQLQIDDGQPMKKKLTKIVASTYLLDDSPELVAKVANAKRVKISFSKCKNTVGGCTFTKRGMADFSNWEFETTLAEQYKDYQQEIR